jgi:hypothetical protein
LNSGGKVLLYNTPGRTRMLRVRDDAGNEAAATADDLEKLGIRGAKDFERAVTARATEVAGGVKGATGKDTQDILRKDIASNRALISAVHADDAVFFIRRYLQNVRVPTGAANRDDQLLLASAGKNESLVFAHDFVRWNENGTLRAALRADLERVGIKTPEDFKRVATRAMLQLAGVKGSPGDSSALAKAEAVYKRELGEVQQLERLIGAPGLNGDLDLVAKSRLASGDPMSPIVFVQKDNGDQLRFYPNNGFLQAAIGGTYRQATVADLHDFGIDSSKAFEAAASHVLVNAGK